MRLLIAAVLLGGAAPALAETRDLRVGGFDRLSSAGPWDVRVHTGRAPSVHLDGPRDALDRLRIEVVRGELRIEAKPGGWFSGWGGFAGWGGRKILIDVAVPTIAELGVSGPGNVSIDRVRGPRFAARLSGPADITVAALDTQALDIDLSGPGNITLAGRAGRAGVRLSGPGDVRGKGLTIGDGTIILSGPGNVSLTAFGKVDGTLSGPGDIILAGRPRCGIVKSGLGSVRCGG